MALGKGGIRPPKAWLHHCSSSDGSDVRLRTGDWLLASSRLPRTGRWLGRYSRSLLRFRSSTTVLILIFTLFFVIVIFLRSRIVIQLFHLSRESSSSLLFIHSFVTNSYAAALQLIFRKWNNRRKKEIKRKK